MGRPDESAFVHCNCREAWPDRREAQDIIIIGEEMGNGVTERVVPSLLLKGTRIADAGNLLRVQVHRKY
eukprot:scaffold6476_cov124-Pinguiococcus_pyrenoidosus.AAC.1